MTTSNWPDLSGMYPALGRITAHWPFVEIAMDNTISVIWQKVPGGNKIAKEVPISLTNKLQFLKKAFGRLPELAQFKTRALQLIKQITDNKEQRHDRIHGGVVGAMLDSALSTSVYHFIRIEYQKTSHHTVTGTISPAGLDKQGEMVEQLRRDWTAFSHDVIRAFP